MGLTPIGEGAWIRVKERLLLDGIALDAADVAPGHEQAATAVEPDLAYPERSIRDRTAVPAGKATHPPLIETLVELAFAGVLRQQLRQT